jgi:tRNA dimethylallyltransferase
MTADSVENDAYSRPAATDCWYLAGATAAGKTKVGIELARRLNAEIISLDSMAVYRDMDIGTAKPTATERKLVPHHLLDLVPPTEDFSLSEYVDAAHAAIAEIRGRGREVLFVGGTPLYLKAMLRGVYQGPPADWEFRAAIEKELESLPLEALHQRLQVIDPLLATKLHPNDKRRIIRGLEVFKTTGQRLSHLQTQFDEGRPAEAMKVFVLSWPREELHRRTDARVESMFAAGLAEEVRGLLAKYGKLSRTAIQAVGYREVVEWLEESSKFQVSSSKLSEPTASQPETWNLKPATSPLAPPASSLQPPAALSACMERVKARTRQFARRQETWFRSLSECQTVAMREGFEPADVAEAILSAAGA